MLERENHYAICVCIMKISYVSEYLMSTVLPSHTSGNISYLIQK